MDNLVEIQKAILENNSEKLENFIEFIDKERVLRILSEPNDLLEGKTFLHLALQRNLINSYEFLLDIGVDASIEDPEGKVPWEYATTKRMKNCLVDYRLNNSSGIDWVKSKIPTYEDYIKGK